MIRLRVLLFSLCLLPSLAANSREPDPILVALQEVDPDIQADHFAQKHGDWNGDGQLDTMALMNGKSGYCGSGGCTLFVLFGKEDGHDIVGRVGTVREPIFVSNQRSNGAMDILVTVAGGGAEPHLARLRFDGKSYPKSPPAKAAEDGDRRWPVFADPAAKPTKKKPTAAYDKTHKELQGLTYQVKLDTEGGQRKVLIIPHGLPGKRQESLIKVGPEVTIKGSEVADLDANGFPEIYVYLNEPPNPGSPSLIAFGSNRNKSISPINLQHPQADNPHLAGYQGDEEYAVVENKLVQRFPVHDSDGKPTGKTRQFQYKLEPGEAMWQLVLDEVVEY